MELIITQPEEVKSLIQKYINEAIESALEEKLSNFEFSDQKEWLTNREAIEYLGVSKSTIQRYREGGELSYSKVRGKLFYKSADLKSFLSRHKE